MTVATPGESPGGLSTVAAIGLEFSMQSDGISVSANGTVAALVVPACYERAGLMGDFPQAAENVTVGAGGCSSGF